MKIDNNKTWTWMSIVMLWFCGHVWATGIMPPDLGLLGNILIYGGIPVLIFVLSITAFLVFKWLKRKGKDQQITHGQNLLFKIQQSASMIKNRYQNNVFFRNFILLGMPYLLILLTVLFISIEEKLKLRAFILVEVLIVYAIIYLLPLVLIKFSLKTRKECCGDGEEK